MGQFVRVWGRVLPLFAVLFFSFQNCDNSFVTSPPSESPLLARGGGEGYEGKVYISLRDGSCSDGSKVDSRVQVIGEKAYYLRESCMDIDPPRIIEGFTPPSNLEFELDGKHFELEFIAATPDADGGIYTRNLKVGGYAPAVGKTSIGVARHGQVAPLNDEFAISAIRHGSAGSAQISFQLLQRTGSVFSLIDSKTQPEGGTIANIAPLSESRALLFIYSRIGQDSKLIPILIQRKDNGIASIIEGPGIPAYGRYISGQPLDENRMLIVYRADSQIHYRVINTENDTFELGPSLTQPSETLTIALSGTNEPALLSTDRPGEFLVLKANAELSPSTPGLFVLSVSGMNVSASNYRPLNIPGESYQPVAVGSQNAGAFFIQIDETYHWMSVINNTITDHGPQSFGDLTMEWLSLSSMAPSNNLFIQGMAFAHLPEFHDGRIRFFDPHSGRTGLYNLHLTRSWTNAGSWIQGTSRLFRMGDRLVMLQITDGNASIVTLSIPSHEALQ